MLSFFNLSGPALDQLLLQSWGSEPAGGAAEDRGLEGLPPPPDGERESDEGGRRGREEQRNSPRDPGHPAASTDQVRIWYLIFAMQRHCFRSRRVLMCVCIFVCLLCRDLWHRYEAVKLVFAWTLLQV